MSLGTTTSCLLVTVFLASTGAAAPKSGYTAATFRRGVNAAHYTAIVMEKHPFGDPMRMGPSDVAWIAAQGFDHIRLPVDGARVVDAQGRLDPERLRPVSETLACAREHGLGLILDLHRTEGADCADQEHGDDIYDRPELATRFARLWRDLAVAYSDVGPHLRFELLNEPIAQDHTQVNTLHRALIAAVREVDRERVLIVNTNRWADHDHLDALELPADDRNIVVSVHYYRPYAFTHQGASWSDMGRFGITGIPFPGVMPDLKGRVPVGHWLEQAAGQTLDPAQIGGDFSKIAAWGRKHDREVYVGEFGAYPAADDTSRRAWYAAVVGALEAEQLGWAVWEYNHSFGVRDFKTGRPTLVLESLAPHLRQP